MYLDKYSNIITVAKERRNNKKESKDRYLFIIDGNDFYSILNKIHLGKMYIIWDIKFINDTMIICYDESSTKKNLLKLIKFKWIFIIFKFYKNLILSLIY